MKHAATVDLATHPKPYVHVKPLARSQDCDPRRILRMIKAGALYAYRVGREWRIPIEEARRAFHVKTETPQGASNGRSLPERHTSAYKLEQLAHTFSTMPKDDNKGQNKVYIVTNPTTGETRTVTQREWREQKLGKAGFEKPPDLDETEEPTEEPPTAG